MTREVPNMFPLHTKSVTVTCHFRHRGEMGFFRFQSFVWSASVFCVGFCFFSFGFTCIFETSREIAVFKTSDTLGLYAKQHLTGAGRAVVFPWERLRDKLLNKPWGTLASTKKKLQGNERFPLRKQAPLSGSQDPSLGKIQHPTSARFGSTDQLLPKYMRGNTKEAKTILWASTSA